MCSTKYGGGEKMVDRSWSRPRNWDMNEILASCRASVARVLRRRATLVIGAAAALILTFFPAFAGRDRLHPLLPILKNGKWGYIDRAAQTVIPPQFDYAQRFSDGLGLVSKDGRFGYVNEDGRLVGAIQFDWSEGFSGGVAAVELNGKWGYLDKSGHLIVEPMYLDAFGLSEGLAPVAVETAPGAVRFGFIDQAGRFIVRPRFIYAHGFSEGLAAVV